MTKFDIEARRSAINWHKDIEHQGFDASGCPLGATELEAKETLKSIKPEYYGRLGRIIARSLETTFELIPVRGAYGFQRWNSSFVEEGELQSMSDLMNGLKSTLEFDFQKTSEKMRSPTLEEDNFDEFIALNSLTAYRDSLLGLPQYGLMTHLYAGSGTAVAAIEYLVPLLAQVARESGTKEPDLAQVITASTGPIQKLAALNIDHFGAFRDSYVHGNFEISDFLSVTKSGVVDFVNLADVPVQEKHGATLQTVDKRYTPTIGCPILLEPKQIQRFWAWSVDVAHKAKIL